MATSNNRDVRLGIEIQTAGEESIKRLAGAVRGLAQEGDPAAAEFQRLANELDRLADQAGAIQSTRTLGVEVERLTVAEREAANAAQRATAEYNEQAAAANALREAQARARAEVAQAKTAYDDLKLAFQTLKNEGKGAAQSQEAFNAALRESRQQVDEQNRALATRRDALRDANRAVTEATAAETKLRTAFDATSRTAASTGTALAQQAAALKQAQQAAQLLGADVADLAASELALIDSTRAYTAEAENQRRATLAAAEASRAASVASAALAAETERAAIAARNFAAAEAQTFADLDNLARAATYTRALAVEVERLEAEETELAAQTRAAAVAMELLEAGARDADRQIDALAASLRGAESASREFTAATERAAAAGADDAAAAQARVRAAEALIASERLLTVSQRDLANERDRNRTILLAEAQALLVQQRAIDASAAATARLVRESISLGTALDGTGKSIGRIGTLTEDAFGKTGVRSLQAIEKEVGDVERAMSLLERRFRGGQISADDIARATSSATVRLAALKREADTFPGLSSQFERINASITGLLTKFGALGAAIATVGIAVKPVLDATIALEQMRRTLTTVTGSAEIAQQQIDFLRKVSQQSGQQFDQLGTSYAKFAASALQSGLSIKQTQDVFKSVALAAGNLGLSTDQAKRALEALSQIASKGVVSMEELRQQLGDALPGVLPLLAKELGLTQAELNKVVESGQLLASEAIPAIGRALNALQPADGVVNGMVASWNRFINVVKEAGTVLVEGPIGRLSGVVLGAFAGAIRDVAVVAVSASEAIKLFGLSTLAVFDALRGNTSFAELKQALSDFAEQAGERIAKFKDTAYGASEATKKLGTDVVGLGTSFAKLALDQQRAIDTAALQAQSAEKHTQAIKAEAEATNTLAGLIGDETVKRLAAVEASRAVLLATERQLTADRAVVEALVKTREATEAKAKAEGIGRDAIKATIEALDTKIAKSTADVEKTEAQVSAARAHAEALDLAAESARDNSKRIDELRAAVTAAEVALQTKIRAMVKDAATSEDVRKAAVALASAKGLLRDAINDVSVALERQLALLRADAKMAEASIKLDIERAKRSQEAALAAGNEYEARQQGLRILELEQSLIKSGTALKLQEAEATLRALDVEEKELRLLGQLTAEKAIDIEIRRKAALTVTLEAAATNEANKGKEKEIELTKQGGSARADYNDKIKQGKAALDDDTKSTSSNTGAREENTGAIKGQTSALDALSKAYQAEVNNQKAENAGTAGNIGGNYNGTIKSKLKSNTYNADGLATDSSGNVINVGSQANVGEGEFFDKQAYDRDVANAFRSGSQNIVDPQRFVKPLPKQLNANPVASGASETNSRGAVSNSRTGGTSHTVTINLPGKSSTINTASAGDAAALSALFQQLESAARSAGISP